MLEQRKNNYVTRSKRPRIKRKVQKTTLRTETPFYIDFDNFSKENTVKQVKNRTGISKNHAGKIAEILMRTPLLKTRNTTTLFGSVFLLPREWIDIKAYYPVAYFQGARIPRKRT